MKRFLSAWLLICIVNTSFGQSLPDLNLDDLVPPDAPALTILGVSPMEISRPTSAKAFALNVLNDVVRTDGGLVSDFAMQFSPYWWKTHPDLTWTEYNGEYDDAIGKWKGGADVPTTIFQSLSCSLGLSQLETKQLMNMPSTDDVLGSVGLSFDVLRGRPSQAQLSIRSKIENLATENSRKELELEAVLEAEFGDDPLVACESESVTPLCLRYEEGLAIINTSTDTKIRTHIERFREQPRVGHRVQLAGAVAYRFEGGETNKSDHARSSFWATYSYVGEARDGGASPFQWLAVFRWNQNELTAFGETDDQFDIGARLIWEPTDERLPISLSIEYLSRMSDGMNSDKDSRFSGLLQYDVSDELSVFLSIGENFETNLVPLLAEEDVIAVLGVKISGGSAVSLRSFQ